MILQYCINYIKHSQPVWRLIVTFSSLSSRKITMSSMKVNWYCLNQYFWKLGRMICDLCKSTTEARFSLQLPNPLVAGTEEASMLWFSSTTTELKDTGWVSFTRGLTEQAARLYALGGLTWHIWEQSLSHPCRWRTGFFSKRVMYCKYFMLMCNCGRMDGARGLYQRYGATSSPMALGSLSTGEAHWVGLDKYLSTLASKIPTLACQWIC